MEGLVPQKLPGSAKLTASVTWFAYCYRPSHDLIFPCFIGQGNLTLLRNEPDPLTNEEKKVPCSVGNRAEANIRHLALVPHTALPVIFEIESTLISPYFNEVCRAFRPTKSQEGTFPRYYGSVHFRTR